MTQEEDRTFIGERAPDDYYFPSSSSRGIVKLDYRDTGIIFAKVIQWKFSMTTGTRDSPVCRLFVDIGRIPDTINILDMIGDVVELELKKSRGRKYTMTAKISGFEDGSRQEEARIHLVKYHESGPVRYTDPERPSN